MSDKKIDNSREELVEKLDLFFKQIRELAPEYCKAGYLKVGGSFFISIPSTAKNELFGNNSVDNVVKDLKEKNTEFYTYGFNNGEMGFFVTAFNKVKFGKKEK